MKESTNEVDGCQNDVSGIKTQFHSSNKLREPSIMSIVIRKLSHCQLHYIEHQIMPNDLDSKPRRSPPLVRDGPVVVVGRYIPKRRAAFEASWRLDRTIHP